MQGWVNTLSVDKLTVGRQEAMSNIEAAGETAVPYLLSALHSNDWVTRRNAADMLSYIASPTSTNALQDVLANEVVPDVRVNAALALGNIASYTAINELERAAVTDTNAQVRQTAQDSLAREKTRIALAAGVNEQDLNAYAVAPADTRVAYAATRRNLVVTRDGGKTWTTYAQALPSVTTTLAVSPSDSRVLYAGVDSMGIYKSVDGGHTWTAMNSGLDTAPGTRFVVTAITIDPNNAEHVAISTGVWLGSTQMEYHPLNLMQTTNGGQTWTSVGVTKRTDPLSGLAIKGDQLYALAGNQVLAYPLN
jgi:hypothetical protein